MPDYQLEIKQVVDYPRCRIYREFVQTLIADRSIRTNGGSGLFILPFFAPMPTSVPHTAGWMASLIPFTPASGSAGSASWRLVFVSSSNTKPYPS